MSKCLDCKHMKPLFSNKEFATARLQGKNTYLKMRCNNPPTQKREYLVDINYLITEHSVPCTRYEALNPES